VKTSQVSAWFGNKRASFFGGVFRDFVASARNWAHYSALVVGGTTLMVFYFTLFRFALVPRALAGFGLLAVMLQLSSVSLPMLGHEVIFQMLAPLGLAQLALAGWLIAKGFKGQAASR